MDAKDVLNGLLEKGLNFPTEKITSLYKEDGSLVDDAETQILSHQSAAVSAAKEAQKKALQAKKEEGMRVSGEKWEKRLKEVGVDLGQAIDEEAFEQLKTYVEELKTKSAPKLDPKDEGSIKASEAYRKREKELLAEKESINKDWEAKWAERDAKDAQANIMRSINALRDQVFSELDPVIPEDEKLRDKQKRLLDLDIAQYTWEPDGDDFVAKYATGDKKGERVDTSGGFAMKAKDLMSNIVKDNFPLKASKEKSSAGDPTKGSQRTGATGNGALKKPANKEEYIKEQDRIMTTVQDPKERVRLSTELKTLFEAGTQ